MLTPLAGVYLKAGSTVTISLSAVAASATALDHVDLYANGVLVATFPGTDVAPTAATGARPGQPVRRDAAGLDAIFQTSYTLPGTNTLVNMIAAAFDKLGQSTTSTVASFHSKVTTDKAPLVAVSGLASGARVYG